MNVKIMGVTQVVNNLRRANQALDRELKKSMVKASIFMKDYIKEKKLKGQVLKRRTGRLAGSIGYKVDKIGTEWRGVVGSNVLYSAIHERPTAEERTIRPKHAQYLTIPIGEALTPAGVLRQPATEWKNTFIQRSRSGNLIIFQRRETKITPLFVLKKSVTLPYRPYIGPTLKETKDRVMDILGDAVSIAVKFANKGG